MNIMADFPANLSETAKEKSVSEAWTQESVSEDLTENAALLKRDRDEMRNIGEESNSRRTSATERPLIFIYDSGRAAKCKSPSSPEALNLISNDRPELLRINQFRGRTEPEGSKEPAPLSERLQAWKDSASDAVESIRKRFSLFRRARSLDTASCDDFTRHEEERINLQGSESSCKNPGSRKGSASSGHQRAHRGSGSRKDSESSGYHDESQGSGSRKVSQSSGYHEGQESTAYQQDPEAKIGPKSTAYHKYPPEDAAIFTKNSEQLALPRRSKARRNRAPRPDASHESRRKRKSPATTDETSTSETEKSEFPRSTELISSTSFCSSCSSSNILDGATERSRKTCDRSSSLDVAARQDGRTTEDAVCREPLGNRLECEDLSHNLQPGGKFEPIKDEAASVQEAKTNGYRADSEKGFQEERLVDEGMLSFLHDQHPDRRCAHEEEQHPLEDKNVPRGSRSGVNLWDLRNSLEQSTIELRSHFMEEGEDRRRNEQEEFRGRGTLEVAEESPRSTPSSEIFMSRDKSITDSEEGADPIEGGTIDLAPGNPPENCTTARSHPGACAAERNDRCDVTSLPERNDTSPRQLRHRQPEGEHRKSPGADPVTRKLVPKGNLVITRAVVEPPPGDVRRENRSATGRKVLQDRSANLVASERRRSFVAAKQKSLNGSGDSAGFQASNPRGISDQRRSPKKAQRCASFDSNPGQYHGMICFVDDGQSIEAFDRKTSAQTPRKFMSEAPAVRPSSVEVSAPFVPAQPPGRSDAGLRPSSRKEPTSKKGSNESIVSSTSSSKSYPAASSSETTPLPPTHRYRSTSRCKYQTKPGSSTSSATTSPSSPTAAWASTGLPRGSSVEGSESDSPESYSHASSRSSSGRRGFSRLFKRSSTQKQQREPSMTFCGYTMGRDYCVDVETDRIFKEFLCQDSSAPGAGTGGSPSNEPPPPPSHMLPPRPLYNNPTQLRRLVMKKQYSDSIAVYYGQMMRRCRFSKQKSDSVNCPVDRGVLRRQDKIEEEFDPEDLNERLASTSSRSEHDSMKATVNELREWRQSTDTSRQSTFEKTFDSDCSFDEKATTSRPGASSLACKSTSQETSDQHQYQQIHHQQEQLELQQPPHQQQQLYRQEQQPKLHQQQ